MKRDQLPKPPEGYEWGIEISQESTGGAGAYLTLESDHYLYGGLLQAGPFYSEQQVIDGAGTLLKDLDRVLGLLLED